MRESAIEIMLYLSSIPGNTVTDDSYIYLCTNVRKDLIQIFETLQLCGATPPDHMLDIAFQCGDHTFIDYLIDNEYTSMNPAAAYIHAISSGDTSMFDRVHAMNCHITPEMSSRIVDRALSSGIHMTRYVLENGFTLTMNNILGINPESYEYGVDQFTEITAYIGKHYDAVRRA